jgi:type IV pilus biogenesis protein CpaD/CtpE
MAAYGPDLDEGLPMRSVLHTVVTAALATQPARGSVTQPHNRDGNLGRRLIQRSRWHSAPDVTAGRTASRQRRARPARSAAWADEPLRGITLGVW